MTKKHLASTIFVILWFWNLAAPQVARKPKPLLTPDRRQFPMQEDLLFRARDEQDITRIRLHAWEVFAGLIMQHNGIPVWQTWNTKCDVHLAVPGCPESRLHDPLRQHEIIRSLEASQQTILQLEQLVALSSSPNAGPDDADRAKQMLQGFMDSQRDSPQFASVLFNAPSSKHILDNSLYDQNTLNCIQCQREKSHATEPEREIPPFPRDAVVIKTVWELVKVDKNNLTSYVHAWDPAKEASFQRIQDKALASSVEWVNPIRIDTRPSVPCLDGVVYRKIAPLACFYAYPINPDTESSRLITLVGEKAAWPTVKGKYYLVLMGMHVTTKETPEWTWATFWWHNDPNELRFGADRPHRLIRGSNWRHFLMNTTLSRATPPEPHPNEGPKICYNPFLEETQQNGMVSNCIQCHRLAAYSTTPGKFDEGLGLGLTWRDGTPRSGTKSDPNYFDGTLQTDFMWSLVTAHDDVLKEFLSTQLQIK